MQKFSQLRSLLGRSLRAFHQNEDGMEPLEAIMMLAIAAVVVIGIGFLWTSADLGGEKPGICGIITDVLGNVFSSALGKLVW